MVTILHASDVHFGKPYDASVGEAFQVAAQAVPADLIVVSGDLTQRAKVQEFRSARAWLARLPQVPLVITPGNHDVPLYRVLERIFAPYRNYRTHISEQLDSVTRIPGVTVVSLNSTAPLRTIVNGRIGRGQLAFAARVFREADPSDTRIIVAHHHLAPAPDYEDDSAMPRAREVLDALNEMQVELILGGHLHRSYIGNSLDVYPGADREHGIVIVQSGTTSSHRGRAARESKEHLQRGPHRGGPLGDHAVHVFLRAGSISPRFRCTPSRAVAVGTSHEIRFRARFCSSRSMMRGHGRR